ncbi:MAG TPA: hypothetical protein VML55_02635 [Planctomycetaceae bacterium]|nr:hypothetical protein [Planctomycetaceae bacterium]
MAWNTPASAIAWIWTLGLALVGVLSFAAGGRNKVTFVIGSFFVIACGLSVLLAG